MTLKLSSYASLLALLLNSTAAMAQIVPDAGKLIREIETKPAPAEPLDSPELKLPVTAPTAEVASGGLTLKVEHFKVTGAKAFENSELEVLVADLAGQNLTLAELHQAAARITTYYREQGYFLSRAYLPKQDVSQGIITIAVLEGRLGKVHYNNTSRVHDNLVQGPLRDLQAGQMMLAQDLEAPLLKLSDINGIHATTTLVPGEAIGTSDLNVDIASSSLITGNLELDNFGNKYTGENNLGASLRFNSPLGLGDRLDLRVLGSDEAQVFYRAQYSLPIGNWATELGAAYSNMEYELAEEFAELDATGNAQISTAFARQSLIRSRALNVEMQLQYDKKRLEDRIASFFIRSDKESELYTLTLSGDWHDSFGGGGMSRAGLAYTHGDLAINSDLDSVLDSLTSKTAGGFNRWTPSISRLQNLSSNWSLYAQLHGQLASKNLDSSEKFSIGGSYGVRAYAQGEATGDQGWMTNVEVRYNLNPDWQVYALVDHAEVQRNKKPWTQVDNNRLLTGAGLGLRWNFAGLHINAVVAAPIDSEAANKDAHKTRLWGQVTWGF